MSDEPDAIDDCFESIEDAVASWVKSAGPMDEITVWVTPSKSFRIKLPRCNVPKFLVMRLVHDKSTGQYFARALNWPFLVKCCDVPKAFGLPVEERVIRRLVIAGFVRGVRFTPKCSWVDLQSLHDHMTACSGPDGELFWTPERRDRFREAIALDRRGTPRPTKKDVERN